MCPWEKATRRGCKSLRSSVLLGEIQVRYAAWLLFSEVFATTLIFCFYGMDGK